MILLSNFRSWQKFSLNIFIKNKGRQTPRKRTVAVPVNALGLHGYASISYLFTKARIQLKE